MKDSYMLLGLLQKRAPSGAEQEKLSKEYNNIPTEEERFKWAVTSLADGILYGNWLWTFYNKEPNNTKLKEE